MTRDEAEKITKAVEQLVVAHIGLHRSINKTDPVKAIDEAKESLTKKLLGE